MQPNPELHRPLQQQTSRDSTDTRISKVQMSPLVESGSAVPIFGHLRPHPRSKLNFNPPIRLVHANPHGLLFNAGHRRRHFPLGETKIIPREQHCHIGCTFATDQFASRAGVGSRSEFQRWIQHWPSIPVMKLWGLSLCVGSEPFPLEFGRILKDFLVEMEKTNVTHDASSLPHQELLRFGVLLHLGLQHKIFLQVAGDECPKLKTTRLVECRTKLDELVQLRDSDGFREVRLGPKDSVDLVSNGLIRSILVLENEIKKPEDGRHGIGGAAKDENDQPFDFGLLGSVKFMNKLFAKFNVRLSMVQMSFLIDQALTFAIPVLFSINSPPSHMPSEKALTALRNLGRRTLGTSAYARAKSL